MDKTLKNKLKQFNKFSKNTYGYSMVEWIIAVTILSIIFVNVGKFIIVTLRNGQLVQITADTASLSSRKATDLFIDSKNQVSKIPQGEIKAGSIDPNNPVDGYFDLFNSAGCQISNRTQSLPPAKITVDKQAPVSNNTSTSIKGDIGNGDSEGSTFSAIDCSTSTYVNATAAQQSTDPKYRRQWAVVKDFPNKNDVTFSVIVFHLDRKEVLRLYTMTKSDGAIIK
jgi:hypothetical protein